MRLLEPLPVPTGVEVLDLLPRLARALRGEGPTLLPYAATGEPPPPLGAGKPLAAGEDATDDPTAVVVTTSGSTGEAKGVLIGAAALRASVERSAERLGGPAQWLLALPVEGIGGLQVLLRSLVAGTEPVVVDLAGGFRASAFVAATARLGAGRRCTALVPTQLARLLDDPDAGAALATYDAVLVGGAATSPELLERARSGGPRVVTTYGMTEVCGGCVYDGVPLRDVEVDVAADGRVLLGGPTLARGYRSRPDLTARSFVDGRYVTDDLVRWNGTSLAVLGRADDVVVTGGANVAPALVAGILEAAPSVAAAAVFGRADPVWGERVVAVVVGRQPDVPPSLGELRAAVSARAGRFAAPRELVVVDALPLLAGGKVDRTRLRTLRGEVWED